MSPSARAEFTELDIPSTPAQCDSVILGLHPASLSYENMNMAFRILQSEPLEEGSPGPSKRRVLMAPHASLYHQSPASETLPAGLDLGIGAFIRALEEATGIEAELVGKPTKRFFELAIERIRQYHEGMEDLQTNEVAIIGDDVENDLGEGCRELDMKRILGSSAPTQGS